MKLFTRKLLIVNKTIRHTWRIARFSTLILMAGCATSGPLPMRTELNEAELAPYLENGTATVRGKAFLKTRNGEVRLGAGNTVELVPITSYFNERYHRATLMGERLTPRDPRFAKYVRKTIADAQGNFEFENLPPGDYVALCLIYWEYQDSPYTTARAGGQAFSPIIHLKAGETAKAIATH